MPDDTAGEIPVADQGETPDQTDGQQDEAWEPERARALIQKLRAEAKKATQELKQYEALKAEKARADEEKLSETERLSNRVRQLEADLSVAEQEAQNRALEYAIEREAGKAGIVDPEAARLLLRREDLEFDKDGRPTNISSVLKDLLRQRPYLAGQAQGPQVSIGNGQTRVPRPGEQTFTRSQLQDRAFYEKHRDAIREAMAQGRIVSD